MTLFFAVIAHAIVVLGVVFKPEDKDASASSTLDVILVQHRSERAPEAIDFLAQHNQDGGGESDEAARPATPLPSPFTAPEAQIVAASPPASPALAAPAPEPELLEPAAAPPSEAPKPILALAADPAAAEVASPVEPRPVPRRKPDPPPEPAPSLAESAPTQTLDAAALVERSLAMASLAAELDQRLQAYAERPRRKWISARTREYKYASYMEAWRIKVERIGNLNYPDEARRRKLSGNLLLEVALNADGSLNEVILRRSSGHRVLDDAAIRIVKLAAPFAPLPDSILEETDILHIERTWRFLSSNRFAGG